MYNISFIFNYAPHYREAVYRLIDKSFDCRFYFGDSVRGNIKKMHYDNFCGRVEELPVRWIFGDWCYYRNALSVLKDNSRVYILTGDMRNLSNWLILLWLRLFCPNKKSVLWTHGWYGSERGAKAWVKRAFYMLADKILCYGDRAKLLMEEVGIKSDKVEAIHNSLDYDTQLSHLATASGVNPYSQYFKNDNPILIFVGRLTKVKRLDMILEAMKALQNRGRFYNLVMIGSGDELDVLRRRVEELGLSDYVWFYGACYDEAILSQLIYNADLCISPGNVGLTAIHVMTYGTPVITHDNFAMQMPEFEVIKPGYTGDFFEYNNVCSLVDKIDNWFSFHNDREDIRQRCYKEISSGWTPDFQVKIIRNCLDTL